MESPYKGKTGLRRLWNALGYSLAGFRAAYKHDDAFRQEVLLAALLIPVALWLPATHVGKALMTGSVLLVIIVELLNSAIEAAVDRISLDRHYLAKRAKDIGSAAVLASLANVAVVWGLVLTALLRRKNWHPGDGPPQYPNVTRIFPQKLQRGFINPSRKIH